MVSMSTAAIFVAIAQPSNNGYIILGIHSLSERNHHLKPALTPASRVSLLIMQATVLIDSLGQIDGQR